MCTNRYLGTKSMCAEFKMNCLRITLNRLIFAPTLNSNLGKHVEYVKDFC